MEIIDQTRTGNLDFSEDTVILTGTIIGDVHVRKGALLDLRGILDGNLIVHNDAAVQLRGTVTGNATNSGGTLHVSGCVGGVVNFETGLTTYSEGASVNGQPVASQPHSSWKGGDAATGGGV